MDMRYALIRLPCPPKALTAHPVHLPFQPSLSRRSRREPPPRIPPHLAVGGSPLLPSHCQRHPWRFPAARSTYSRLPGASPRPRILPPSAGSTRSRPPSLARRKTTCPSRPPTPSRSSSSQIRWTWRGRWAPSRTSCPGGAARPRSRPPSSSTPPCSATSPPSTPPARN